MFLILASLIFVAAMLVVRLGLRAATRQETGGWPGRLVEWVIAPGVTLCFALSFAFAFEHFLHGPEGAAAWMAAGVSLALLAGLAVVWRLLPVARPAPAALTPVGVGPVADAEDDTRAA